MRVLVTSAFVADDSSGIYLWVQNEDGKKQSVFVPTETWGKIPSDKNPKQELQIIADAFNGTKRVGDKTEKIPDWEPKIINLEIN